MNKSNLLIGAVSTNYTPDDIKLWVKTSNWDDCDRILLLYKASDQHDNLTLYLKENNIGIVYPTFDFWGNPKDDFLANTGMCNLSTSFHLVHNIRFFHIWNFLNFNSFSYKKILITDVRDVYFNSDPFIQLADDKLTVTDERITYNADAWNTEHLRYNLGLIGMQYLFDKNVFNVGVFGGSADLVKDMCSDIYLLSCGKHKVADQTSFNYLIQTKYKDVTNFTDDIAIHLHVVSTGLTQFDFNTLPTYSIVHQHDRIPELKKVTEAL